MKQSFVANVIALSEAIAMTDASKRRGEAVEDLSPSQEFVPVEKVKPEAKPIVPKANLSQRDRLMEILVKEHRMAFLFHRG